MSFSKLSRLLLSIMLLPVIFSCNARQESSVPASDQLNRIISIGPSNTEILVALGFGEKIIAADTFSEGIEGIASGISIYSMMSLDLEHIINQEPDIVFVTGLTFVDGDEEPLRMVSAMGIPVIYIHTSNSIADVIGDIRRIAEVMGAEAEGALIVSAMEREINRISQIAATIPQSERRTVYFEISPAPFMYSFGRGTYLNEMIELTGGENIFYNRESWMAVPDEILLAANPDVIISSVDFVEDPVTEILGRPGWSSITAVQNRSVYTVNANHSNRPSQNIILALGEIAKAIYPEYY